MDKKRIGLLAAIVFVLTLAFASTVTAAYPNPTAAKPIASYGWKKAEYTVYADSSLTTVTDMLPYQECNLSAISGRAAKVTYKVGKQTKDGWIDLKRFIYNPDFETQIAYANSIITLYKRPTVKEKYIKIPLYTGGIEISEKGSWVQVLFCVNNQYKLGWMKKTKFVSQVRLSMNTSKQLLANGTYTISPRKSASKALTYNADTNRFKLAKNKQSVAQQFKLQQVSGNYYLITPQNTNAYLGDGNLLTTYTESSATGNRWLLKRTHGYFYIIAKETGNSLAYSTGNIKTLKWQKISTQQWCLEKLPEVSKTAPIVVFSQYDPKWGGSTYMNGPSRRTISTSGCGVMALTNAIYALNGEFISPTLIAKFSAKRGHYFYNQGTADSLYSDFGEKYGKTYHFQHAGKVFSLTTVKKHLQQGGTALALVPGHYIAITAYRASDKRFLVLDSAIYGKRPTTINGDWLTAAELKSGYMYCEYFHLFSRQ